MINQKEVEKLAKLAKIRIKDEEIKGFADQIYKIVHMLDTLDEVDCPSIEPLTSVNNNVLTCQEDVLMETSREEIFCNLSPKVKDLSCRVSHFIVPKVIE